MLNNFIKYIIIRLTSNEVLFEFKIKKLLNILNKVFTKLLILSKASEENMKPFISISPLVFLSTAIKSILLINYRFNYINAKNFLKFTLIKIKEYYDTYY